MPSFSTVFLAAAASFTLVAAAPASKVHARQDIYVQLIGADNDPTQQYSVPITFDTDVATAPYDPFDLSISYVNYDHAQADCTFTGIDEATAPPVEANGALGPPQVITSVYCTSVHDGKKIKKA